MGTSSSGGGAGNGNPLIPSWIPSGNPSGPDAPQPDEGKENPPPNPEQDQPASPNPGQPPTPLPAPQRPLPNRYTPPKRDFGKFVRSGGTNSGALRKALRGYSRNAAGGTSGLARRMTPSAARVAGFAGVLNTIRVSGVEGALRQFNISGYSSRSLLDTLSALCDEVFKDTGRAFENTQDDSISKQAYANTVVRICEMDGIDLNKLTDANVELMIAIFIEETISQRVITDIGNNMTRIESDASKLVEMENTVYQIVNGLVRNAIMPEIIATQRGDKANIEKNIENVYRIAFDVLSNINN